MNRGRVRVMLRARAGPIELLDTAQVPAMAQCPAPPPGLVRRGGSMISLDSGPERACLSQGRSMGGGAWGSPPLMQVFTPVLLAQWNSWAIGVSIGAYLGATARAEGMGSISDSIWVMVLRYVNHAIWVCGSWSCDIRVVLYTVANWERPRK